jgi:tryptophan halogenase
MTADNTSIVIVGGGSAGWMAANYFATVLEELTTPFSITVIESSTIATIGVGEATIPTILPFFQMIGLSEIELLVKTNATLKTAIRFDDWLEKGHSYFHPFEGPFLGDGYSIAHHWAGARMHGQQTPPYAEAVGVIPRLCQDRKVTKHYSSPEYQGQGGYAYHLDARLLADLLTGKALSRGVTRIEGTVDRSQLDEHGHIASLITADGREVEGTLFVDCTGFGELLIGKALGATFHSYSEDLLCDAAVATPTAHPPDAQLNSYTVATAHDAGWIWQIDLASRRGNGYVYSSSHLSADDAAATLAAHVGVDVDTLEFNQIRMRVGRREEFWKGNCLALGLSGGFIEPLESTGLQLIELGLRVFWDHFSSSRDCQPSRDAYNGLMVEVYDEIRDFIVLHYLLSRREDTQFWRDCTENVRISDRLSTLLERWRFNIPCATDFPQIGIFGHVNYSYVLGGMERLVPEHNAILRGLNPARSEKIFAEMQRIQNEAARASITQNDFVNRIRAPFEP